MTPAINVLNQSGSAYELHQFKHTAGARDYGREAAQQLGVEQRRVFKTLLVRLEAGGFVIAMVPVSGQLDLKKLAQIIGERKACLANLTEVPRITGYTPGGVSPLGLKKSLRVVIDEQARLWETILISAGKRGVEVSLSPDTLAELTHASFHPLCR